MYIYIFVLLKNCIETFYARSHPPTIFKPNSKNVLHLKLKRDTITLQST